MTALFAGGLKGIGLSKSVGEIDGLLFSRDLALSLDVSKGKASQDLKSAEIKIGTLREMFNEGDVIALDRIECVEKLRCKSALLLPILQKIQLS
ncbi:MAG: hypothetical protein ABGY95_12165 [Rubritalea sp.]|uniref:hypothetical protein n=1 Tax=Rubritalea sp. TaxID=2109375 RepID=UPI0032420053